ncbi:hypothetical protein ABI59_15980 [Acidobacteria bacterium Mor1]|nr:hypothetical protein ABI59_15980 [Acidobacteria bacterium Mor1]
MRLTHVLLVLLLLCPGVVHAGASRNAQVAVVQLLESLSYELEGCEAFCGPRIAVCATYDGSLNGTRERLNAAFEAAPEFKAESEWIKKPRVSRKWSFGDAEHPVELEVLEDPNRIRVSVRLDPLPQRPPLREPPLQPGEPGISEPRLIRESRFSPCFPDRARQVRLTANVIVRLVIGPEGHVRDVEVLRCTRPGVGFEEAVVEAVRHWRYHPPTHMGRPVSLEHILQISFEQ